MNLALSLLDLYFPVFLKKRKLRKLFTLTADAFRCGVPSLAGLEYEELLNAYSLFAREQCEQAMEEKRDMTEVKKRLYQGAFESGTKLGKQLYVRGTKEVMAAARIFYAVLGIEFRGGMNGDILIRHCYFSPRFTPRVCWIISSLDAGVMEGLSGGMRLTFTQRITEGKGCCKAVLRS